MYPKQGKGASGKQSTREQLSELLINKFRNKYNVNVQTEREIDSVINKEVSKIVKQQAPVGERELNEVDRCISNAVKEHRGEPQPKPQSQTIEPKSRYADEDQKSHVSKAPSQVSRARSVTSSAMLIDPEAQIRMCLQGKVIGMTDAEWSAQVNHNVSSWQNEEREKQNRLKNQRE